MNDNQAAGCRGGIEVTFQEKIEYMKKYSNYPEMYDAIMLQGVGNGEEFEEIKERMKLYRTEYEKIRLAIMKIQNPDQSKFLYYKYIKKLSWSEISERMNYSTTQLHRIRKKAINNIDF